MTVKKVNSINELTRLNEEYREITVNRFNEWISKFSTILSKTIWFCGKSSNSHNNTLQANFHPVFAEFRPSMERELYKLQIIKLVLLWDPESRCFCVTNSIWADWERKLNRLFFHSWSVLRIVAGIKHTITSFFLSYHRHHHIHFYAKINCKHGINFKWRNELKSKSIIRNRLLRFEIDVFHS